MAWSVLASPIATGSSSSSLAVNVPTGTQNNDILLAHLIVGSSRTITPPAGWTLLAGPLADPDVTGVNVSVYYRVASSEPASFTFSFSGTGNCAGVMLACSGGDAASPIDASATAIDASSSTSHAAPSVTTTRDGNLVVVLWGGWKSSGYTWTQPSGFTERYDSNAPTNYVLSAGDAVFAKAGATGTLTGTTSVSDRVTMVTVALNVRAPIDIELTGDTPSDGSAELSHVRRLELSGDTPADGAVDASRIRDLSLTGDTPADGQAAIQGGTVRVELSGDTPSDGAAIAGKVRRIELTGDTPSDGQATPGKIQRIELSGDTPSDGEAAISRVAALELSGDTPGDGSIELELANRVFGRRLRLDVFSPAGALVTRVPVVFGAEYRLGQDEVGEFSLSLPAADERVALLTSGQRIILYREGEGRVFAGIVGKKEAVQDAEGGELLAVTGASRARELVRRNTMTGASYEGLTVSAIATDLLTGTGWAAGDIATDPAGVTILGIGKSYWEMLAEVATRKGWHIRENNLAATIDIGPFGASSGLVVRNIAQARGWSDLPLNVLPLTGIKITEQQEELVNQVVILGGGEGPNALTLRYATRSTPYTVKQGTDQRGNPYWYLEDEASILEHGLHQGPPVVFKDIIPLANSAGSFEAAANALYDAGTAWLRWHAEPVESYEIQFVGLRHYDHGAAVLNPGDTLRLQYRGYVAREADGTTANRVWRNIDAELHVLEMRRSFNEDGSDTWSVTVSTSDQRAPDDTALMAETYARLHSVETALRPYTVSDTVGPLRDSVDGTHPFRMEVVFDANVTYLLKAALTILVRPVRSNTTGAASGGGGTGNAGGDHSHTIDAQTTGEENPKHGHEVGQADNITTWSNPGFREPLVFATAVNGGTSFGVIVGRDGTTGAGTVLYTTGGTGHTHSVSATTSRSGGNHSHSLSPHSHALVYGIFEGPNPSNPDLRLLINGVDVTAALGGPWDTDVTLDVTQFLVDATQQVLRQNHTIEVKSNQLADIVCHLRVINTITGVHPV
ncbi:hypothetical protein [Nitrolancea hollandica]|uniref:Tip attachment protein J domain-containing protein n=1 Tax=Nitrolancea hollandica Lb TaxID=1129897 RepID=I4EG42_9BACT|nr:hypothetical protein [Nitrolancea hollandica]CCF83654.1 exported hypothetical protein [Nitrolancea hollandica Lb]